MTKMLAQGAPLSALRASRYRVMGAQATGAFLASAAGGFYLSRYL